jgi:hypothetical protein
MAQFSGVRSKEEKEKWEEPPPIDLFLKCYDIGNTQIYQRYRIKLEIIIITPKPPNETEIYSCMEGQLKVELLD